MSKVALFVYADTETHGDMGRVFNALIAAKELKEAGNEVKLIFDGAGTKWIGELSKPDHRAKPVFDSVKDVVSGACGFCANAFQVKEAVTTNQVKLMEEYEGHPSFDKLVADGYQIITF